MEEVVCVEGSEYKCLDQGDRLVWNVLPDGGLCSCVCL